ncbi:hypothetical protein O0I10_005390 [Lichtheimia ornata]|uniref:Peptidase S9 prolyl oligopeptidase catalytic domain-containing protein n=1 Tax=Lichtheimia ornata TaxID=688661 RepID=A0AAD7V5L0_9FUNG|nr:uncharacterized protein O0I10_005390 [Lichtheimia ornata]KAJ8659008.1 hypothetical protein O0I10_005390 [Lichtheimia ornata]
MVEIKPFGSWPSPVSGDSLSGGISAADIVVDRQIVYWCEVVPAEQGRGQIFYRAPGNAEPTLLLPLEYNCRTRVHEYGGGSFTVKNGLVVFSNNSDGRLYTANLTQGGDNVDIKPLTPDTGSLKRYGDMRIDEDGHYVVCVEEEHFENEQPKDVVNRLVSVSLKDGAVHVLAEGNDFYTSPRLSGSRIAYITYNHSNMPWDFTMLYLADFAGSSLKSSTCIAANDESVVQPEFGVDGTLYFASDRSGFWNLYRYHDNQVKLLLPSPLEQEFAGACWALNMAWYRPAAWDANKVICMNKDHLAIIDVDKQTMSNIEALNDYVDFDYVTSYAKEGQQHGGVLVFNATSDQAPCELVAFDCETSTRTILREPKAPALDREYVSRGQEIEFPTEDGLTAFAYYYPPRNPRYQGPTGEKPPLRVLLHGGPTAVTNRAYNRSIQYWTTRGFAIADVNYGGSTGYGRAYRNRLKKKWGIVDVNDCCNAALYLVKQGWVDGEKLTIVGGSAGGYTTLASIAFRDVFKAACCKYGVSDITLLAKETHKFESRYPDELIGKYPEDEAIYKERSPLFSADLIKCPVIFFQGADDKIVPPSQSEVMVDALKKKNVPVSYVLYQGEGHGFRRAENIKRTVELELWFYGQMFGFPVEGVEGVEIYNFPKNAA